VDTVAAELPASPQALVAAVACPFERVVCVTRFASRTRWLPSGFARQRDRDVLLALETRTQSDIAAETGISRQRVSKLVKRARGEHARHD